MHIRTFRAANLQAALAEIRRQMGPSAAVLHTRQVRDGWWGWLGRSQVEVTAGLQDQANLSGQGSAVVHSDPGTPRLDARSLTRDPAPVRIHDESDSGQFPSIFSAYQREMESLGVPTNIAKGWLDSTASFSADLGEEMMPLSWDEQIQRTVARNLRIAGPIRTQPGERHVVALIGPTGVGKTTTIAKLAAGFRLESRRRVGLLTIDTFRIAAVQQLEAYAQIMDLPMEVVETQEQMRPAMQRLGDVDLVLIDTAGRSPRSDARIEQLTQFLDEARPDETHLVISATSSPDTIRQICHGFAPARPNAAIISKLDETPQTAGVLAALEEFNTSGTARTGSLPLSYTTNGQQVPDDIDVADANQLVERLLPTRTQTRGLEAA